MSDSTKAVFLSYASQDADAARRICDALRAAGVEVCFDQAELRGGEAWDARIRQQIKECALFMPIISAHTQARKEGHFRLEWRLADQRARQMGKSKPFIMAVPIDDIVAVEANAPDSFMAVQWTRLPLHRMQGDKPAEIPPEFAEQVKMMMASGEAYLTMAPFSLPTKLIETLSPPSTGRDVTVPPAKRASRAKAWLVLGVLSLLVLVALAIWHPWR